MARSASAGAISPPPPIVVFPAGQVAVTVFGLVEFVAHLYDSGEDRDFTLAEIIEPLVADEQEWSE